MAEHLSSATGGWQSFPSSAPGLEAACTYTYLTGSIYVVKRRRHALEYRAGRGR
jgi:hypothetical protein